jgi:hypothetical protein
MLAPDAHERGSSATRWTERWGRTALSARYTCPVCGYPWLTEPPHTVSGGGSYEICRSCGIEFGYRDTDISFREWRHDWVDSGMPWSASSPQPPGWDPAARLGFLLTSPTAIDVPALPPDECDALARALEAFAPAALPLLEVLPGRLTVADCTALRDAASEAAVAGPAPGGDEVSRRALWRAIARLEEHGLPRTPGS